MPFVPDSPCSCSPGSHARLHRRLLAGSEDPHAELMALVWGPRFDREHALGLWAGLSRRQPVEALPVLPALLSVADRFDALAAPMQHRIRRLIARHRSG